MKVLYLSIFLFLLTLNISGQLLPVSPDTPQIEVIKKKWQRIEARQRTKRKEDTFRANDESNQRINDLKQNSTDNERRSREGLPPVAPPVRLRDPEIPEDAYSDKYTYEIKIKNSGEKEIRKIICDYVFLEPTTQEQLGRISFVSEVNIKPGKTKDLNITSPLPPSKTIDVGSINKNPGDQYSEQVIIKRIEYVDGSVWTIKNDSK